MKYSFGLFVFVSCLCFAGCVDESAPQLPNDDSSGVGVKDPAQSSGETGSEQSSNQDQETPDVPPPANGGCEPVECDGVWVCLQSDELNCGACYKACSNQAACVNGVCVEKSPATGDDNPNGQNDEKDPDKPGENQTDPGTGDDNPGTGDDNPGTGDDNPGTGDDNPGAEEPPEQPGVCSGSVCNGECVDIKTDNRHCGGCGYACGEGLYCKNMNCACTDPALTKCAYNTCVNMQSDPNHCGKCNNKCASGVCSNGKCTGGSSSGGGEVTGDGQHVIEYARQFLYERTHMCTYDLKRNGKFPTLIDLSNLGTVTNYGYNLNCANFVSSVLIDTGEVTSIPGREEVANIKKFCEAGKEGYHILDDPRKAQAGDIWYKKTDSYSHTELIVKVEGDYFWQIGSTSFGSNETVTCENNHSTNSKYAEAPKKYQKVMERKRAISDGGVVCSKR